MPLTVQRYLCQCCLSVYNDYNSALNCEMLPIPPNPYPEGSVINFENEENGMGVRWSYSTMSGVVLFATVGLKQGTPKEHAWVWVVKINEYTEAIVEIVNTDFGPRLMSLAEKKHSPGFAGRLKADREHARY